MNKNTFFQFFLVFLLSLALFSVASAADKTFSISGFVDASYTGNIDQKKDTFGLDQVEVDMMRYHNDDISLRTDLEFLKDGNDWVVNVEQGFLQWNFTFLPTVALTFGKFNAPIGFELLDAPDMYQFSHALVFDHGLPTNLTGLMASFSPIPQLDVNMYICNGWDENDETNGPKTAGGRVGYALMEEKLNVGLSYIAGKEILNDIIPDSIQFTEYERSVLDIDLSFNYSSNLIIGGEFNQGSISNDDDDYSWSGFMIMGHYELNDWMGFTARFGSMDDPDSWLFGENGETRNAITIAPTFTLPNGIGALIEYRMDTSTEEVYLDSDGNEQKSTSNVAVEFTYTF